MFNSTERERKKEIIAHTNSFSTNSREWKEGRGIGFIEFMSSFIFAGPRVRCSTGAERRREREGETEAVIGIFFSPTQAPFTGS